MNPVFMFSGQGAQKPGMGESLFGVPEVKAVLDCASDVLGYDVADLMVNAPAEKLNDTRYAQPATCALSVGIASALQARGVQPQAVLGFSLGQVSALAVSGMLTYEETFSFVAERARLMAQAAAERPGVMSALLKADEESVALLCKDCAQGQVLVPANFNCPGQIVVSGELAAVERAEAAWGAAGKRYARLATSGAFHSPLMQSAADELDVYLAKVEFKQPSVPLICNVDAEAAFRRGCAASSGRSSDPSGALRAKRAGLGRSGRCRVRRGRLRRGAVEPGQAHRPQGRPPLHPGCGVLRCLRLRIRQG